MNKTLKRMIDKLTYREQTELSDYLDFEHDKNLHFELNSGLDINCWIFDLYYFTLSRKGKWSYTRDCFVDRHRHEIDWCGIGSRNVINYYWLKAHPEVKDE